MALSEDREDDLDDLFPAYAPLQAQLGSRMAIERYELSWSDVFSLAFIRLFLADSPNYRFANGSYGASRSNWTYHTAMAVAQAAKLLNWNCKFETLGKRDAVVATRDDPPIMVLAAEWEWDTEDIFAKGKELDKLRVTCANNSDATAFLLTYCTEASYPSFVERVVDAWCPPRVRRRTAPGLYLHTIVYVEEGSVRVFDRLRTAVITSDRLVLWCDEFFD
jgi:hypothetical protein